MELSSKQRALLVSALCFIIVLGLGASYFFVFPPLNEKIAQAEQQLDFEVRLLETVQAEQGTTSALLQPYEIEALQRQVPVKPLVDQFIFDLEKAEIYSDSFIVNYSFAQGEFSGSGIALSEDDEVYSSERLTVNMSVITPDYEQLFDFLQRIEQLERITKIDQLSFSGNPEVTMLDQTADDITFSITISTFYLPELEEFAKYLPEISYPTQANRFNPLYDRGDRSNEANK